MTRLAAVPEVMRWRAIDVPEWTEVDVNIMIGSLGTINGSSRAEIKFRGAHPPHRSISPHAGVQPEKHVLGSQKLVGGEVEDITFSKIQRGARGFR